MRKQDYAALAAIIRHDIEEAQQIAARGADERDAAAAVISALQDLARQFAERANVDRTSFLMACGISPNR